MQSVFYRIRFMVFFRTVLMVLLPNDQGTFIQILLFLVFFLVRVMKVGYLSRSRKMSARILVVPHRRCLQRLLHLRVRAKFGVTGVLLLARRADELGDVRERGGRSAARLLAHAHRAFAEPEGEVRAAKPLGAEGNVPTWPSSSGPQRASRLPG